MPAASFLSYPRVDLTRLNPPPADLRPSTRPYASHRSRSPAVSFQFIPPCTHPPLSLTPPVNHHTCAYLLASATHPPATGSRGTRRNAAKRPSLFFSPSARSSYPGVNLTRPNVPPPCSRHRQQGSPRLIVPVHHTPPSLLHHPPPSTTREEAPNAAKPPLLQHRFLACDHHPLPSPTTTARARSSYPGVRENPPPCTPHHTPPPHPPHQHHAEEETNAAKRPTPAPPLAASSSLTPRVDCSTRPPAVSFTPHSTPAPVPSSRTPPPPVARLNPPTCWPATVHPPLRQPPLALAAAPAGGSVV